MRSCFGLIYTCVFSALFVSSCGRIGRVPTDDRETFRFTVTADSRGNRREFRHVLSQISTHVADEGVFHLSVGDVDPVPDNHIDLVREFGVDVVWIPVVGNHDDKKGDISWIRDQFAQLPFPLNAGPPGTGRTTYSFDYGHAHIVIFDFHRGNAKARLKWLDADLSRNRKPVVFVAGHVPRYGERSGRQPDEDDAFWSLLEKHKVTAYLCGHSHIYSRIRPRRGHLWQIDVGNAGNESHSKNDGQTFLNIIVGNPRVRFEVWRGEDGEFQKADAWSVKTRRRR